MIPRRTPVVPKKVAERVTREQKIARARRLWLDLNARLGQAQKHGISLAEATRRLEEREVKTRVRSPRRRPAR